MLYYAYFTTIRRKVHAVWQGWSGGKVLGEGQSGCEPQLYPHCDDTTESWPSWHAKQTGAYGAPGILPLVLCESPLRDTKGGRCPRCGKAGER